MSIEPDDKDWTWVLNRPCDECGFNPALTDRSNVSERLGAQGELWTEVLRRPDVSRRRSELRWSDLEYGCHVRDVLLRIDGRLDLMLHHDDPVFANWDQDATALEDDYASQDPAVVLIEIGDSARALAGRLNSLGPADWARPGQRSNGSRFTVESLAVYATHDVEHHLHDVGATPT